MSGQVDLSYGRACLTDPFLPVMDHVPGDQRAQIAATSASEASAGNSSAAGSSASIARPAASRPGPMYPGRLGRRAPDEVDQAHAAHDVGEEIERETAAEGHRRDRGERLVDVPDRLP